MIVVIAAFLPMGAAIQRTGLDVIISDSISVFVNLFPADILPYLLLALIYFITSLSRGRGDVYKRQIIMTPITLSLAASFGFDPKPFIFAVCYAASASFITPVGYQTNLMVFGPGGYRYSDYIKVGLPLGIILWIISVIMIPMIWPF